VKWRADWTRQDARVYGCFEVESEWRCPDKSGPTGDGLGGGDFEGGAGFDDGVVVGEGVERLHHEAALPRLKADQAHGADCHPATGIKRVHQAIGLGRVVEFLLEGPEDRRDNRL